MTVPWCWDGRKAASQFLVPLEARPRVIGQDHERGQIVVHAAQAVADPAPHGGEAGPVEAGRLQQRPLAVHAGLADHVVDEGDVVDDRAQRRDGIAEQLAARPWGRKSQTGLSHGPSPF